MERLLLCYYFHLTSLPVYHVHGCSFEQTQNIHLTAVKSIKKQKLVIASLLSTTGGNSDAVSFPSHYVLWSMLRMCSLTTVYIIIKCHDLNCLCLLLREVLKLVAWFSLVPSIQKVPQIVLNMQSLSIFFFLCILHPSSNITCPLGLPKADNNILICHFKNKCLYLAVTLILGTQQ